MKNTFALPNVLSIAILGLFGATIGCGGKVEGNAYEDNGGVVKIEFKSGGKAFLSAGPATTTCTYSESGKTVTMICVGDKTVFTVDSDGDLNGPPDGFMGHLTKKK